MQNNKVCIIMGGSDIIFAPLAREMANSGYVTAIIDTDLEWAQRTADEICTFGGLAKAYYGNASDKESLELVKSSVVAEFGGCNVLINNAGLCARKLNKCEQDVNDIEVTDFNDILIPAQVFGAKIKDSMGSILNLYPMELDCDDILMDKLEGLTRKMAVNLSEVGIRVNTVAYGRVVAGIGRADSGCIEDVPMQRAAKPREIIGAVKFLTDAVNASYITGETLHVDGGYTASKKSETKKNN